MTKRILASIIVLISLSACERFTVNYAGVGEPADAPEYTIPLDKNKSPAEPNN